jgi:hypothetical protein
MVPLVRMCVFLPAVLCTGGITFRVLFPTACYVRTGSYYYNVLCLMLKTLSEKCNSMLQCNITVYFCLEALRVETQDDAMLSNQQNLIIRG